MSAILAKAMNSTMGTSDFKAFDTLIMKDKSIAYSETVLCSPPIEQNIRLDYSQQGAIADVEKEIISLRMRATGSFGIKETTTVQDSSKVSNVAVTGGIRVYRNGKVFSDGRKKLNVRICYSILPTADRLIGNAQAIRQLLLRQFML